MSCQQFRAINKTLLYLLNRILIPITFIIAWQKIVGSIESHRCTSHENICHHSNPVFLHWNNNVNKNFNIDLGTKSSLGSDKHNDTQYYALLSRSVEFIMPPLHGNIRTLQR